MQGRKGQGKDTAPRHTQGHSWIRTLLAGNLGCGSSAQEAHGLWAGLVGNCQLPSPQLGVPPAQVLLFTFLLPVLNQVSLG